MVRLTDQSLKLPLELLVRVFGELSQRQLGVASVVCSTWTRAALLALKSFHLSVDHLNYDLIPGWLRNRAQQLHHLQLCHAPPNLDIQLPFGSTAQLCSLTLHAGVFTNHVLEVFSAIQNSLTSLSLCLVAADDYSTLFNSIAVLRNLRSLCVTRLACGSLFDLLDLYKKPYAEAANSLWPSLQHLTSLALDCCNLEDSAVSQITQLVDLQHLALANNYLKAPPVLIPLSTSLTYLDMARNHKDFDCSMIFSTPTFDSPATFGSLMLDCQQPKPARGPQASYAPFIRRCNSAA